MFRLLFITVFLSSSFVFGQTPNITLTTSLGSDNAVCQSTPFTLTVSDTQTSLTTYTLTFGSTQVVSSSTLGIVSFSISGLTSQTVFTVVASSTSNTDNETITVFVPILSSSGSVTTQVGISTSVCYGTPFPDAIYGDGTYSTASATLSANSSAATISYTWQISNASNPSWRDISGATSSTLSTNTLALFPIFESTSFRRLSSAVKGALSCSGLANPQVSFTVDSVSDPIISSDSGSFSVCDASAYTYRTSAVSGVTHRWYLGATLVQTGDVYTMAANTISTNTALGLRATNSSGCSSNLVTETLLVAPKAVLTITTGLTGDVLCPSDSFTLTVQDAQSSNTTYTLTYGSQQAIKNSSTGIATFTISGITSETTFSVTATPASGCATTTTKTVLMPIMNAGGTVTTVFTTSLCYGDIINDAIYGDGTASSVSATLSANTSAATTISYTWEISTASTPAWTAIVGATGTNLATNTLGNIYQNTSIRRGAYARISTVNCDVKYSNEIAFTVDPIVDPTITGSLSICSDAANQYSVSSPQVGYTYHWFIAGVNQGTGNNYTAAVGSISGNTTIGLQGVTSAGCSTTLVTSTITLSTPLTLSLTTGLTGDVLCPSDSFTLTVSDTQTSNTTYTLTYGSQQAIKNSSTGIATFTISGITSGTTFSVISAPATGCSGTAQKNVFMPQLSSVGSITTAFATSLCYGDIINDAIYGDGTASSASATLVTGSPGSVYYQWQYKSGSNPAWTNIAGANGTNLATNTLGNIYESITIRRLPLAQIGTVTCTMDSPPAYPEIVFTMENIDGGTISPTTIYTCDINGASYNITVSDNSFGNIRYQWQSSSSNVSATFTNINAAILSSYSAPTNITTTTFYRRVTTSATAGSVCAAGFSNIFEFTLNSLSPGVIVDPSGIYCLGSVPPVLGLTSAVTSTFAITYQWYKAETNDLATVEASSWSAIASETSSSFVTPALSSLFRYVLYRRGVIEDRGAASACETYTNIVTFDIFDAIDIGYIEPSTGLPDFPYCVGDRFPNLRLISADNNIFDNTSHPGLVATWELSRNGLTWTTVNDIDTSERTFNRRPQDSNSPADAYYLDNDYFFRVKLVNTDATLSANMVSNRSVRLVPKAAESVPLDIGESFRITIGSSSVSVTITSTNSTTDIIGEALANKIDSDITNYTATYHPESNIISIEDIASNNFEVSATILYQVGQSLQLNVLQATNGAANCTSYSAVYKIDVVNRPVLTVDGGASSQFVCDGTAINTIPISWTGGVSSVIVSNLNSGLSINIFGGTSQLITLGGGSFIISGTTSMTITGVPTSDHTINIRLNSWCRSQSNLNIQYSITTGQNPPEISNLFRDSASNWSGAIWYDNTEGFNNTVCINSTISPSNTSSLTTSDIFACFNADSLDYGGYLDWEFIDKNGVSNVSPTLSNSSLRTIRGKEEGTRITWNPSFVASVTYGAWVTVKVRAVSTCSSTIFSNFFERDVWVVRSDQTSQTNNIPILPVLNIPVAKNVRICGVSTGSIPICEPAGLSGGRRWYTQFFTSAAAGTNNYGALEWELTDTNAGSIDSYGVVTWTQGYYGNTKVRVRPSSCAEPVTTDSNDWVESNVITILQVVERIPNITQLGLPTCPIPATGIVTTTLQSDIPVDWYIKASTGRTSNTLIRTANSGTVTFTTNTYNATNFYKVEPNFGGGDLEINWSNTASGVLYIKAVPQGCSGTEAEWIRDFTIVIPNNPRLIVANNNLGATTQEICENERDIVDIIYDVVGRSVQGVVVTDVNSATSIYAQYINAQFIPKSQVSTVTFNTGVNINISRFVVITINDYDYKIEAAVNETSDSVAGRLASIIDGNNNLNAVYNSTTNNLTVTSNAGYYYTIFTNNGNSAINLAVNYSLDDQIYSQIEVRGLTGYIPEGIYQFKIGLVLDSGCEEEGQALVNLIINGDATITLTSSLTTLNQDVCYNESIDPVVWSISDLDSGSDVTISPINLPSNISGNYNVASSTFTLSSSGVLSNNWNTRVYNYVVSSEGDLCDEATQNGSITVYPRDFLRPELVAVPDISQLICEGEAIEPIKYEFWGSNSISATIQDLNGLALTTSTTFRTQIASITFDSIAGVTSTNTTEFYSLYINNEVFTVNASLTTAYTASNVLTLLSAAVSSTVATSTIDGNFIVLTGLVSGTTFAVEGRSSNSSAFSFDEPYMSRAPNLLTITGTPTLSSTPIRSARETFQFNVITNGGNYCNGVATSALVTYTLDVDPLASISVTSSKTNLIVCDGFSTETIDFLVSGGSPLIEFSAVSSASGYYPPYGTGTTLNVSTFSWLPNQTTNVTTMTVYTYTATTTANSCGSSASLTVTGTLTVYPHYLNKIVLSGLVTQTVFNNQAIDDIEFDYSSYYSNATITWPGGDDLGLTLSTSGTVLTLSGSPSPSVTPAVVTSYPYQIMVESKTNLSPNCYQIFYSGTIIIKPEINFTLTTSVTTVNQEVYSGTEMVPMTIDIDPAEFSYTIEWRDNLGNTLGSAPPGLTLIPHPDFANVTSLTLSGTLLLPSGVTTPSTYFYRISTVTSTANIPVITFDGSIVGIPAEKITTSVISTTTICQADPINLVFNFIGIKELTLTSTPTPTLPLGLTNVLSYQTTPTFEINIVADSSVASEVYQIQISDEDGSAVTYSYTTLTSLTTSGTIASGLAATISSTNTNLTIQVSGTKITLSANSQDYVFRIKENIPNVSGSRLSVFNSNIRISEIQPVTGSLTVTGTIQTQLATTTTISLTILSTGVNTDVVTQTVILLVKPNHFITSTTTATVDQVVCDNSNLSLIEFQLSGGATDYGIVWSNGGGAPTGLSVGNISATNTFTISGTLATGVTTTTSYPYTITTTGNNCNPTAVISGTITVEPNHYIALNGSSGAATQNVCDQSALIPIIFNLSGGATGFNIVWSPSDPGVNITNTATNTFTISGTLSTNVTVTTVYSYTISTTGNSCNQLNAGLSGQITIEPKVVISVDTPVTQDQVGSEALCSGDNIQNITYSIASGNNVTENIQWYDSSGSPIGTPGPTLDGNTNILSGAISTADTVLTNYTYIITATSRSASAPFCVFTDTISGIIQVAPIPVVKQAYIISNDMIHVSCPGGNDGSIIIPTTPTSELLQRITGGQIAGAQVDKVTLVTSNTLNAGDVVSLFIESISYSITVASGGTATVTILNDLADEINDVSNAANVTALVVSSTTPPSIKLTADVPGVSFTSSGNSVSSTVTGTTIIANETINQPISYAYAWTSGGAAIGNSLSLNGLSAGTYNLIVNVNGCPSVSTSFVIEEPSTTIGTVSFTCDGGISLPVDSVFTPTQLALAGPKIKGILYELSVDGTYSTTKTTQEFVASTASQSFIFNFNGVKLDEGQRYKVNIYDNFCSDFSSIMVGPVDAFLAIDEDQISVIDEECINEGGSISVANGAITGGSGSFLYSWTNTDDNTSYFTKNLVGASDGTYTLTITDQLLNCTYTITDNVIILPAGNTLAGNWASATNITTNLCSDGRLGRLQYVPSGGGGTYEYVWEFIPQTSTSSSTSVASRTIQISNNNGLLIPGGASEIPSTISTSGQYKVFVYDGSIADNCPAIEATITISGPNPVSLVSTVTFQNIVCAGEDNGSIQFTVTGGIAPYFYSLTGGTPSTPLSSGNNTHIESNLPPGQYNIVIKDSSDSSCTPFTLSSQVTIAEPVGGALALSKGEITLIPCSGGTGSFEVNVTGGSEKIVGGSPVATTLYQVRVVGPGGSYSLNTSHERGVSSFIIDNLVSTGDYVVTVTDGSGNCSENITIAIANEGAVNLVATAEVVAGTDCTLNSFNGGNSGASINIKTFLKGDGEVSGYPLWQRRTSINLEEFKISVSGTIVGVDLSTVGILIGGSVSETIDASGTASASLSTLAEIAANLADKINALPNYSATLNGSTITVRGQIIDNVSDFSTASATLNISVSNISQVSESAWVEVAGAAGLEKIEDLQAGIYRGVIKDGSGCGASLVQNVLGGNTFTVDDPQALQFSDIEFDEITCALPTSTLRFRLSNGTYNLIPDPSAFELTLNSNVLESTVDGTVSFSTGTITSSLVSSSTSSSVTSAAAATVGTSYTPNLQTNIILIDNIIPGDYELVVKNTQTECVVVLNFSIKQQAGISYSGETEFEIDPCFETYQDDFFDALLIEGGSPFVNLAGDSFYSLGWTFYPQDTSQRVISINSVSNNVNFSPSAGRYELLITDANGCTLLDEAGATSPIEFNFSRQLNDLVIAGTGGATGSELSQPVSCEIDAEDGQINLAVSTADPLQAVPPYEIRWDIQAPSDTGFEQKLLFQGIKAGDSLEVYTIELNDQPFSYVTQVEDEPIASVISEFANIIDQSTLFVANVDASNSKQIIITTESQAILLLNIISKSTRIQMVNSSSNVAVWAPLDGTNGNTNYTGYLDLNNLAEGLYRYTITAIDVTACDNNTEPNNISGIITVENENVLEIREGPIVNEFLCGGQSGEIFIDVFDGNTGPLTFFYNNLPVTFDIVGDNQYIVYIDNPEQSASLEIYNAANCGISREIKTGNGTPLYDFTSSNFELSGTFLAREDITFVDLSQDEYDSFEFIFGDGTETDRIERNTPDPILHEYAISGTYLTKLRIYNDIGCVEELIKNIKIGKGYSILVPNVFTPNGDIYNPYFRPVFNGLSEVFLRIYDSTGGLIYEEEGAVGSDPKIPGVSLIGWSGLNLTSFAPYYIYTITGKTTDNEDVFRDGTFIILR